MKYNLEKLKSSKIGKDHDRIDVRLVKGGKDFLHSKVGRHGLAQFIREAIVYSLEENHAPQK